MTLMIDQSRGLSPQVSAFPTVHGRNECLYVYTIAEPADLRKVLRKFVRREIENVHENGPFIAEE